MTFEVLSESEALRKWDEAETARQKREALKVIADLTVCKNEDVKRFLENHGRDPHVYAMKKKSPDQELMEEIEKANAPEEPEEAPKPVAVPSTRNLARTIREDLEAMLKEARNNVLKWQAVTESYEAALRAITTAEEVLA